MNFVSIILLGQDLNLNISEILSSGQVVILALMVWRVTQLEKAVKKIQDHCWMEMIKTFSGKIELKDAKTD